MYNYCNTTVTFTNVLIEQSRKTSPDITVTGVCNSGEPLHAKMDKF